MDSRAVVYNLDIFEDTECVLVARASSSRFPSTTPSPCFPTARILSPSTGGFRVRAWSWTAVATCTGPSPGGRLCVQRVVNGFSRCGFRDVHMNAREHFWIVCNSANRG